MATLQITLDERVADAIRAKAQKEEKTPEALAAEIVSAQAVPAASDTQWVAKFMESARQSTGNSGGWKRNRDELYDR